MSKYNDTLVTLLKRWFQNKQQISRVDFEMLQELCKEVLK